MEGEVNGSPAVLKPEEEGLPGGAGGITPFRTAAQAPLPLLGISGRGAPPSGEAPCRFFTHQPLSPLPRYLIPCSHVMLSQKRAVKELDLYGKAAAKFLSLIPRCCCPESLPTPEQEEERAAWSKGEAGVCPREGWGWRGQPT